MLRPGTKLLMTGDSITDCDRKRPIGRGADGLGSGYVSYVDLLLQAAYPMCHYQVLNTGVSGDTLKDLAARWQSDVLDQVPNWLVVMVGVNDMWRQFDSPGLPSISSPREYAELYGRLVEQTLPEIGAMVLMTPFLVEPDRHDPMRALTEEYAEAVRRLAARHDREVRLVDTQAAFDAALEHRHPAELAWDRIHPTPLGHMLLARAFLQAIDYPW